MQDHTFCSDQKSVLTEKRSDKMLERNLLLSRTSIHFRTALVSICTLCFASIFLIFISTARVKTVLEDAPCTDEQLANGSCHVDGNEQWKDEDVNEKWATTQWMNGFDDVTPSDVNSDDYNPWSERLASSMNDSPEYPSLISGGQLFPPTLPPNMQVLTSTSVVVTTCDSVLGCKQTPACVDRWDWRGPYGGCPAYRDWKRRLGWCDNDHDVFGVPASVACPVSCDTCPLGMCFDIYSNQFSRCFGGLTG
mmetsp:Transcript_2434/g.6605  ORF Transcript_2434/g.6605 Transcript_2434/m.6605 type:complete len:250 (+) Transcript_2434:1293-2042(+)